ncbi:hypothetical protein F2Q69_00027030 [Brassica cretica]|uniref:Uncharacterized protein n=1 Tax=Brassica cretica TaxID=69181 RepID=A0A8S9SCC6_BRACR|nr:hypothetical protein F2Q69_00027030 [Brassica cretica]
MGRDAMCAEEGANVQDQECLRALADRVFASWNASKNNLGFFGIRSLHQLLSAHEIKTRRFQKTKTAPRIVSASEGALEIGSTNGLR